MDLGTRYQHHILWQYGRIPGLAKGMVITFGYIPKDLVPVGPENIFQ